MTEELHTLCADARQKLAAAIAEAERVGMRDDHDLLRETFRVGPNALALTVAEARALLAEEANRA